MKINPLQDILSQFRISVLGDNLMRKYNNEKSPLRSELFSTDQMEQYAKTLAASHSVIIERAPEQLLTRLAENEEMLLEVHNLITESAKANSRISPAAEWLLDNFYLIEEQIYIGKKHFPKRYSEGLPRLLKGPSAGLPRVYDIALEIISHSDGRVDLRSLGSFIGAYQTVANLNLGELWAIPIMLRLALIENLRRLAAQIAIDRINKNLADYWADEMTEIAEKDPKNLIVVIANMAKSNPPMVSSFVAELTRRLLGKGPALALPLTWIEQRLSENGMTTNGLVHTENQKQAADQVSMSNSISSLRFLSNTDWREFVETNSVVEQTLRQDTGGIYAAMDFDTRDQYRHVVEKIAKRSKLSEQEVAQIAIQLAKENAERNAKETRTTHVGFYLIGKGLGQTEKLARMHLTGIEMFHKLVAKIPLSLYIGLSILFTLMLSTALFAKAYSDGLHTGWLIGLAIVSVICISQFVITLVNWLVTLWIPPHFLPRMDFSRGIPHASRTLVVVPAMLDSISELENLIEKMEVRFLANRNENLHFALLTD
ncbi:MAG TPA: cyclic beta 1-2 glucan synthetase, partial [Chitinophagaceae bacterium]|nr:cyclic beta 1-2 glucan synthetase [Chitinophagaceae bacterium]